MILVDTSVWVEHLRRGSPRLAQLLQEGLVLTHPSVTGDLACANLAHRDRFMSYLHELPSASTATDEEVLTLIERYKLWGRGIGWVDTHLLASAKLSGALIWSADERLVAVAEMAQVRCYRPSGGASLR